MEPAGPPQVKPTVKANIFGDEDDFKFEGLQIDAADEG